MSAPKEEGRPGPVLQLEKTGNAFMDEHKMFETHKAMIQTAVDEVRMSREDAAVEDIYSQMTDEQKRRVVLSYIRNRLEGKTP